MTEALKRLREPFPANLISKLPKPTKQQTEAVKANFKEGIRCKECGAWHHPDVVHLDYVGHAALTDRLLDVDPLWTWEPVAFGPDGLPVFDKSGGLWIKLTICGVTRLGYGNADPKNGQDAGAREKEVIGDALRNAGMRFGAALDLWHKGDLHANKQAAEDADGEQTKNVRVKTLPTDGAGDGISDDRKIKLEEYAQYITDCKGMDDWIALKHCLDELTENEEKLYLWTKLKSDVRSYIKKHQEEDKANG